MATADKPAPTQLRSARKRDAILKAANALLDEKGIAAMTMEEIAERAGVAKTTVYRRWPSKGALAVEGFLAEMSSRMRYDTTASALADIKTQLRRVAVTFRSSKGPVIAGIIAEVQRDPETRKAFLEGYVITRRKIARGVIERAIALGEIAPHIDIEEAMDLLYSPIYYRLLVGLPLPSNARMDAFVDRVVAGLNGGDAPSTKTAPAGTRRAAARRPASSSAPRSRNGVAVVLEPPAK